MTTPSRTSSATCLRDTAVAPGCSAWEERRYQRSSSRRAANPASQPWAAAASPVNWSAWRDPAARARHHRLRAARSASLPSPAARAAASQRQGYLVQLLAPSLHAAWVRTQLTARRDERRQGLRGSVLTLREYGHPQVDLPRQSNFEIGAILKISPLTTSAWQITHVQISSPATD